MKGTIYTRDLRSVYEGDVFGKSHECTGLPPEFEAWGIFLLLLGKEVSDPNRKMNVPNIF